MDTLLNTPQASTLRLTSGGLTSGDTEVMDVLRKWHDENHAEGWDHCMQQPCHAVHGLDV